MMSLISLYSCEHQSEAFLQKIEGQTMGTTYHVSLVNGQLPKTQLDSLLTSINMALSTYIDSSLISQINQVEDTFYLSPTPRTAYLLENLSISDKVYQWSQGFFDPTVMPLVNLWGFGYEKRAELPDSSLIREALQYVGWEKLQKFTNGDSTFLIKKHPLVKIDFSAVAKGYGVDIVSKFLSAKGYQNHMVEIGGEVRCSGQPHPERNWLLGISTPEEGVKQTNFTAYVEVKNKSIASSGNYQNFYEKDGKKYTHTINPKTGYSSRNPMLGTTIITDDCATADALATAAMALGPEKAKEMLKKLPKVEALLIYNVSNELQQWMTPGFPIKK